MGRNRGARGGRPGGGGHPFFATHNGGGGASATNGFTFTDIDDEPKFVELPDDFETDSGEETTKSSKTIVLFFRQMIHIFAKNYVAQKSLNQPIHLLIGIELKKYLKKQKC